MASLFVKGKPGDIDLAAALHKTRRQPHHRPVTAHLLVAVVLTVVAAVHAEDYGFVIECTTLQAQYSTCCTKEHLESKWCREENLSLTLHCTRLCSTVDGNRSTTEAHFIKRMRMNYKENSHIILPND